MVTIDASVLVAVDSADEGSGADAREFLRRVVLTGLPVHQPTLSVVEVSSAIARRTNDVELARSAALRLLGLPNLALHTLDPDAALEAADLAGRTRLRAADAVYAAVALREAADLVTLDLELLERAASVVSTLTPATWLARHAPVEDAPAEHSRESPGSPGSPAGAA